MKSQFVFVNIIYKLMSQKNLIIQKILFSLLYVIKIDSEKLANSGIEMGNLKIVFH